jgi:hypothetical protein
MSIIPDNIRSGINKINFELFTSKTCDDYVVNPDVVTFLFEGETLDELDYYCESYEEGGEHLGIICAWVAANFYDTFIEWTTELKYLIGTDHIYSFFGDIQRWDSTKSRDFFHKMFDDLSDEDFDHTYIWTYCVNEAIQIVDKERVTYLMDVLETLNTGDKTKDKVKNSVIEFWLRSDDIILRAYPQLDILSFEFKRIYNITIMRHMINCGYEMTNADLISVFKLRHWNGSNMQAVNDFFLENFHKATLTDDFIDKCFAASINQNNVQIFKLMLDNHNPDLNKFFRLERYDTKTRKFKITKVHCLSAAILNASDAIVTELMNRICINNLSIDIQKELIEILILYGSCQTHKIFIDNFKPCCEIVDHCLDFVLKFHQTHRLSATSKKNLHDKINKNIISFMLNLGCVIDEEYFFKILEFVDPEGLDFLLKTLNLTLDGISADLIVKIVNKYSNIIYQKIITIQTFTIKFKYVQFVMSNFKNTAQQIQDELMLTNCYIKALVKICQIDKEGDIDDSSVDMTTKIDSNLFKQLHKFCLDAEFEINHPELLKDIVITVKDYLYVVDKCYDHKTVNENGGRIPKPIDWSTKDD